MVNLNNMFHTAIKWKFYRHHLEDPLKFIMQGREDGICVCQEGAIFIQYKRYIKPNWPFFINLDILIDFIVYILLGGFHLIMHSQSS
jgi:hypothetical protein